MLYGILITLYTLNCFLLVLLIMIQQGKNSLGLGSGGSSQMLFGGSGGQDILQKTTWFLGSIYLLGALGIVLMGSSVSPLRYLRKTTPVTQQSVSTPVQQPANTQ